MWQIKVGLAVLGLAGAGFVGFDYYNTIQDNAVLESSVSGLTQSIVDANTQINDYAIQTETLQEAYKFAMLREGETNQQIESHDYEKLARRKPDKLESVLNSAIASLWDEIRDITGYQSAGDAETSKAATSEPSASDSESD